MRKFGYLVLLFVTITSVNCSKDKDSEPDSPGTITITMPTTGNVFDNGFPLRVQGEMSDNNVIGLAKLEIRNKATNALLNQQTVTLGSVGFYRFDWTWNVTGITASTVATVRVFNVDKLGNQVTKDVDVTLNP
jgi:hypothetical protein